MYYWHLTWSLLVWSLFKQRLNGKIKTCLPGPGPGIIPCGGGPIIGIIGGPPIGGVGSMPGRGGPPA